MQRREFISLLGGVAAWPVAASAQPAERVRRVGVLMPLAMDDPEAKARFAAFQQGLEQLGWTDGRNVQIDTRWAGGDMESIRKNAEELVALSPDVILAAGGAAMTPLHQATRTVPIVFTQTPDPVGAGFVASLARPGGNATGFALFEFGISVKWLELLKEIAPHVARAAALRDPALSSGLGELGAIQGVAPTFRVELSVIDVREAPEIERAVTAFARHSNGALIVLSSAVAIVHRDQIIRLAARHQLPTVYFARYFVAAGGLISYGPDTIDPHRRAAAYVDRILRAKSRPTFRCRRRPSTSWRSTSRPLRRSALQCLQRCSRAPTRWSSSLASASARLLQLLTAACGTQETVSPAAERSAY